MPLSLQAAFSKPLEALEASKVICQASLANTDAAAARVQSWTQFLPAYSPGKYAHAAAAMPSPFQPSQQQQQHPQQRLVQQQQHQAALLQGLGLNGSSFSGAKAVGSPVLSSYQQQPQQMQRQSSASSTFASPPASPHWKSLLQLPSALPVFPAAQVKQGAAPIGSSCMPPPPPYTHGAVFTANQGIQLQAAAAAGGASRTPVLRSLPLVTAALAGSSGLGVGQPPLYTHMPAWPPVAQPTLAVPSTRAGDFMGVLDCSTELTEAMPVASRGAHRVAVSAGGPGGVGFGALQVQVPQWTQATALGVPASPHCSPSITHLTAAAVGMLSPGGTAWGAPVGLGYHGVAAAGAMGSQQHVSLVHQGQVAATAAAAAPFAAEQCFAVEQASSTTVNAAPGAMGEGDAEDEVTAPAARNGSAEAGAAAAAALEGQGESVGHLNRGAQGFVQQQACPAADPAHSSAEHGVLEEQQQPDLVAGGPSGVKLEVEEPAAAERTKSNHSRNSSGNLAYLASAATAVEVPVGASLMLVQGVLDGDVCAAAANPAGAALPTAACSSGSAAAAIEVEVAAGGVATATAKVPEPSAAGLPEMRNVCPGSVADNASEGATPAAAVAVAATSLECANPTEVPTAALVSTEGASDGLMERQFLEKCEKSIAAVRYQQAKAIADVKEQWAMKAAALAMELAKAKEEVSQILASVQKEADLQVAELKHELEVGLLQLQARKGSAVNPIGPNT